MVVPPWSNRHPRGRVPAAPWAPAGATSGAPRVVEDPRPLDAADRLARARRGAGGVHGGRPAQCSSRQGRTTRRSRARCRRPRPRHQTERQPPGDVGSTGPAPDSNRASNLDGDPAPDTAAPLTPMGGTHARRHPRPRSGRVGPVSTSAGRSGPCHAGDRSSLGRWQGARVRTADASPGGRRGEATAPRPGRVGADARGVRDVHRRRPSHRRGRNPGPRDPRPANGRRWAQAAR